MQSILMVSNNENLIGGVQNHLLQGNDNIELKEASSIPEAIQKIKENQFDIIISEFQTSAIDGSELLKTLYEKGIKVPFIMLLDHVQKKFYSQALNLGVDYCIINHDDLEIFKCEICHIIQKLCYQISLEKTLKESENRYYSQVEQSIQAVTIIQNAEKALQESEHYLKEAQGLAKVGHWRLEPKSEKIIGSDELFRIFDLTREEATLEKFLEVVHPDDREYDMYHIQRGMEFGESWNIEHRLIVQNGTVKHIHAIGEAQMDNFGKVIQLIGTVQDITEQKRMFEELQVSEEKYKLIVETAQEGLLILDDEGKITFCNPRMEEMLGYSEEILLNQPIFEFMDSNLVNNTKMVLDSFKNSIRDFSEIKLSRRDGNDLWVLFNSSSILNAEGKSTGILGMLTDITEKKKREEDTLKRLMKYNIEKGNLYLTVESTPTLTISVIDDMVRLGHYTSVISRNPKSDFGEDFHCDQYFWLSEKTEKNMSVPSSLEALANLLEIIPRDSIVLYDRLDYLISRYGFKDTLNFVYKLKDLAIIRDLTILLSIDPDTITRRKLKLLEKETKPIESRFLAQISDEILQLLRYIYSQNKFGKKPSYSDIGNNLDLSRPTARKKIKQLVATGYINEQRFGNQKLLEITEKGRSLFVP